MDRKEYFNMFDGKGLLSKQPESWKKGFEMGAKIPKKERNFVDCKANLFCVKCDKLISQTKIFTANLNGLKRLPPNETGHMLPWYTDTF